MTARLEVWKLRVVGAVVFVLLLAFLIATEPMLAIGWDEGYTIGREARVRAWLAAISDPLRFAKTWAPDLELLVQDPTPPPSREFVDSRTELFRKPVLRWFWPFAREEPHGHPPFYAIIGLLGDLIVPSWQPLPRARLGPMVVFAAVGGAIATVLSRRWGRLAGLSATSAWTLQPRLFAEAHYAAYDGLLTSLWVGAILSFWLAVEDDEKPKQAGKTPTNRRWIWTFVLGLVLGCAAATKLTGWLFPGLFIAWSIVLRRLKALETIAIATLVAALVVYLLNPPWWADPVDGVSRFFRSNQSRAETIPIQIQYLGHIYNSPKDSLPWSNTLVWTFLVTPVGFLVLSCAGLGVVLARPKHDSLASLVAASWVMMLVLRALPHTPGHDGVRQFLPAFGSLALLAGFGAKVLRDWSGRRVAMVLVGAICVEGAIATAAIMPTPLSYYSPLVGGPAGAELLGMEPTYYWDALSDRALGWLNRETPPGSKVRFASYPTSLLYLRRVGKLEPLILPNDPGRFVWYVVQNRSGALSDLDRHLIAHARPRYVEKTWGVPLLWIFPYTEVEAWQRSKTSPPRSTAR